MINTPITANSIVGFDIDKYIKGDLSDNRAPEVSAPIQLNQNPTKDSVEINGKKEDAPTKGWKLFGSVFIGALIGLISAFSIKRFLK